MRCVTRSRLLWGTRVCPLGPLVKIYPCLFFSVDFPSLDRSPTESPSAWWYWQKWANATVRARHQTAWFLWGLANSVFTHVLSTRQDVALGRFTRMSFRTRTLGQKFPVDPAFTGSGGCLPLHAIVAWISEGGRDGSSMWPARLVAIRVVLFRVLGASGGLSQQSWIFAYLAIDSECAIS